MAIVEDDGTLHPFPGGTSLLDLLRAGPAALREAGDAASTVPGGPHVSQVRLLPPLQPPSVRDFVTFEEHVEGVRRRVDGAAGVPDAVVRRADLLLHQPVRGHRRARRRARAARLAASSTSNSRSPPSSAARAATSPRSRPATTSSATRSSTTGPPATSSPREMKVGLGPCKGKDTATTLGPYLVTADELEPYRDADGFLRLALTAEVNGEDRRQGPAVQHELDLRGDGRLRLARHRRPPRRRPRLRHLRQRRLPGRAVGRTRATRTRRRCGPATRSPSPSRASAASPTPWWPGADPVPLPVARRRTAGAAVTDASRQQAARQGRGRHRRGRAARAPPRPRH